jgi:hypothetical protein
MLWRGHAIQGRCQPGRRAVLEETSWKSDHHNSTPCEVISQAKMTNGIKLIACIFNWIEFCVETNKNSVVGAIWLV